MPPPETEGPPLPPPLLPTPTEQWQLVSALDYDETGLLEVQRSLGKMAAALGDRVAVLGLPKHYRLSEALNYQQQLLSQVRLDGETTDSYLAFYHPWLISRDESGVLIHTEPTGANVGVMAALSLAQGAWIAPANERLQDTLATIPIFALGDEQTLYRTGLNPIRQTPGGFVAWGSYTQSLDPEFEDLNVRRLLILLRRLALQEGRTYVFAPHSAAFRRRLQQRFERVLGRLFNRGAFAGRTPTEAFQVVLDGTLNTPTTIEQGQLIVELRVAPAQPLTFITVRLVQQETDQLTVQEVQTLGS
jgi:phage tail sheath protein FI